MSEPRGIDREKVSAWLTQAAPDLEPPFAFELIAAGGSNLTFRVSDAQGRLVALRRPPVAARIATAHDVGREHRILDALSRHDVGVPVPRTLGLCTDERVLDAPFYVMEFVDGLILRDRELARGLSADEASDATESLVDTQIAFHTLDVDAIGLGDLANSRSGYVERQLRRWRQQADASKTRELPLLAELHQRFERSVPKEQARPALAHGDYRFDNTILGAGFEVMAVLDWELCTLGDPVADFFWSQLYWADPGDPITALTSPPTLEETFPLRDEVTALYARRSGFDLSEQDWYTAFSWWKQACIVEGVVARIKHGASGGMRTGPIEEIEARVDAYLELADQLSRGVA